VSIARILVIPESEVMNSCTVVKLMLFNNMVWKHLGLKKEKRRIRCNNAILEKFIIAPEMLFSNS